LILKELQAFFVIQQLYFKALFSQGGEWWRKSERKLQFLTKPIGGMKFLSARIMAGNF
jgi:hypothetical protein